MTEPVIDEPVIDLALSRAKIDAIDEQLVDLFQQRMAIAKDVAAYKRAVGKPVLDATRERQKISAVTDAACDEFKQYMPGLFSMIMEMSRSYQHAMLDGPTDLTCFLKDVTPIHAPNHQVHVACQGVSGAYSHIAATELFRQPQMSFETTWDAVCDAVESQRVDFGVLPLENSTAGSVDKVYNLLSQRGLYICGAVTLRVNHCLLVRPGTRLEDIRVVCSHEQALQQCAQFIDGLEDVRSHFCKNTALAASVVAKGQDFTQACIASKLCADIYGLEVLQEGIQDEENNFTRFICVSSTPLVFEGADTSSFLLVLHHEAGSLFRVLSRIAALGINMVKLESRPIPGREFEFMFYVDVESVPGQDSFAQLIQQIPPLCDVCTYLGSYSEISR